VREPVLGLAPKDAHAANGTPSMAAAIAWASSGSTRSSGGGRRTKDATTPASLSSRPARR